MAVINHTKLETINSRALGNHLEHIQEKARAISILSSHISHMLAYDGSEGFEDIFNTHAHDGLASAIHELSHDIYVRLIDLGIEEG